jgi:hypothetical protein
MNFFEKLKSLGARTSRPQKGTANHNGSTRYAR